jgi:hypothetical protein
MGLVTLAYFGSGSNAAYERMVTPFYVNTTIATVYEDMQVESLETSRHLWSCTNDFSVFRKWSIFPQLPRDLAPSCSENTTYFIDPPDGYLSCIGDSKIELLVRDPLEALLDLYSAAQHRLHPWMHFDAPDEFFQSCTQFSEMPYLHWFSPSDVDVRNDISHTWNLLSSTSYDRVQRLIREVPDDQVSVVHVEEHAFSPDTVDLLAREPGVEQSDATSSERTVRMIASLSFCASLSEMQVTLGFPPIKCQPMRVWMLLVVAAAAIAVAAAARAWSKRSETTYETEPLKR